MAQKKEKYIRQRPDGRWEARLKVGEKEDGSPDIPSVYFASRDEARAYVKKVLQDRAQGVTRKRSGLTLGQWCDQCLELYGPSLQESTYLGYQSYINNHVKGSNISRKRLEDLTKDDIQLWANSLKRRSNNRASGPLSPKTVRLALGVMTWLLSMAVESKKLIRAPETKKLRLPKTRKPQRKVLSPDAASALLAAAQVCKDYPAYVVDAVTGMRRSELLGLCWDSVDLDTGAYTIRRKVTRHRDTKQAILVDQLKSEKASRAGQLPASTLAILRAHRRRQLQVKLAAGPLWREHDLLFPTVLGFPELPNTFSGRLSNLQRKHGLERVGINGFRHLVATTLIRAHADDATIAEAMGHSSAAFTRRQYADVYEDSKRIVANITGDLLDTLTSGSAQNG